MSRITWLKKEIESWVKKGIISRDQADQIIEVYPSDSGNRLISVLFILGAVLLGAGIILFFASNWQYIPKWAKIGLVIAPLVLFHLFSQLTSASLPRISAVLSFLGCIMFGSGIWLIAQIYHINAHFPNGILFWILGVLPAAFFLKEELPLGLSALLLGIWVVTEHSVAPGVVFVGMVVFAALFYLTYTCKSSFALVLTLISSIVFINTEAYLLLQENFRFDGAVNLIPYILLLTGSSVVYISRHPVNSIRHFPFIFNIIGIFTVGLSLFMMSLEHFSKYFLGFRQHGEGMALLWVLYIITAVFGAYALSRRGDSFKVITRENFAWLAVDVLAFVMLLVPFNQFYLAVTLNLFIFVWALSLIVSGFQLQNSLYFTLGIIFFNFFVITEYFNFFWKMLPKSLFFIVGGAVLIAGGSIMERKRRKIIQSWQGTEVRAGE